MCAPTYPPTRFCCQDEAPPQNSHAPGTGEHRSFFPPSRESREREGHGRRLGREPRGPAGRGVLTWPAEPAEMVGVAAHGGAVGGGGEAVAAAQGLRLHGVLQVGPAEEASSSSCGGAGWPPRRRSARGTGTQPPDAAAGLHRLQQRVQRALLEPLQQRVRDRLEFHCSSSSSRERASRLRPPPSGSWAAPTRGCAGFSGSSGGVPLREETAGHRLTQSLSGSQPWPPGSPRPARSPQSRPRLGHGPRGAPERRRLPAPWAPRCPTASGPPQGYRADFRAATASAFSGTRGRLSELGCPRSHPRRRRRRCRRLPPGRGPHDFAKVAAPAPSVWT